MTSSYDKNEYKGMSKRKRLTINLTSLALMLVAFILILLIQGGYITKSPTVKAVADNCYAETLRVITDQDYRPYSFFGPNGEYEGYDVELITLIANKLQMNLDLKFMGWNDGIKATIEGQAEVLMTCDNSDSFAGVEKLIKSEPTSFDDFMVYSKSKVSSVIELYGHKIAIMENGNVTPLMHMLGLDGDCVKYKDNRMAMQALLAGDVDFAIMRQAVGATLLYELDATKTTKAYFSAGQSYMCFGINEKYPELAGRINAAFEEIKHSGEYDRLQNKWLSNFMRSYTFVEVLRNNLWIDFLFFLIILYIVASYFMNKERGARHKAEYEQKIGDQQRLIKSITERYNLVYSVNLADDSYQVLRIDENILGQDRKFDTFFDIKKFFLSEVVHPTDAKIMEAELDYDNIRKKLSENSQYKVEYRALVNGATVWNELSIARIEGDEVAISFALNDLEIVLRHIESQRMSEYNALMVVDLDTEMIKPLKVSPEYKTIELGHAAPYGEKMKQFAETLDGEARDFFIRMSDIGLVKEEFARDNKLTFSYKANLGSDERWIDLLSYVIERHPDGTPAMITLAFSDSDALATSRNELQKHLKTDIELIGGLASEYHALYYFNIDEGYFKIYSIDEKRFPEAKNMVIEGGDPLETFRRFGASPLVHDDDKWIFEGLTGESVREKLEHRKKLTYKFRRRFGKEFLWTEMEFVKYEDVDERANAIALGFAERDAEIRREMELAQEQELANQQRHIKAFGDMINAALWNIEISGEKDINSVEWSDEMRHMLGYQDETDLPNTLEAWTDKIHPEDKDGIMNYFWESVEGPVGGYVFDIRYRLLRKTGDYCWYHALGRIEQTGESKRRMYGIITDISADKKLEEQQMQLEKAYEAADVANKSKTSFLFNMSHDIRTPMNAISGFTAMAKKYVTDPRKVSDYLEKIDISSQQLLMLINQVLEMSRIESGKIEIDEKPVVIRDKFDSLVTILAEQANSNGLEFHHSLSNIRHETILADEAKMSQITLNIAGNAIKFTPEGGRIDFSLTEEECDREGYARFTFTVADTGVGMSEDFQKVLFDPFSREKSSTISRIQGTGLGMSIVKSLVDHLGGTIKVESELGKGSKFDVTIDFKLAEGSENVSRTQTAKKSKSYDFTGRRVLLVEDNELNREIARFLLEDNGFVVEEAEDGDVAVQMVQAIADRGEYRYYDFILMDIQMPRMNGYEATAKIRAISAPEGIHLPIIAVSANAFEEDKAKSIEAGMDAHIAKPIDVKILWGTLAKFL